MTYLYRLVVLASRSPVSRQLLPTSCRQASTWGVASLCSTPHSGLNVPSNSLLQRVTSNSLQIQQVRHYKAKDVLTRRCDGCYFERRDGRWFVECTLKPRHKQMQKLSKNSLHKDDYSKGNVYRAFNWGHQNQRYYRQGDNKFSRYNWLEGRLGTEV